MSDSAQTHDNEPHSASITGRLNWLRAAVLGANDGIVSVAALVVGVAGATHQITTILTAGVAGLVGGAISMALGEYVSVSSQSDSQKALIAKERHELATMPDEELAELAAIYQAKGLSPTTAKTVALELTAHDALAAHLEAELHITETEVASAWHASIASALAFLAGGILPLAAILLAPEPTRVAWTFGIVLVCLVATGVISSKIGGSGWMRPTIRIVIGGTLALLATFGIGWLLGTTGVV